VLRAHIQVAPGSNLGQYTGYLPEVLVGFLSPSMQVLRQYLDYATTPSLQTVYISSFTNHSTGTAVAQYV